MTRTQHLHKATFSACHFPSLGTSLRNCIWLHSLGHIKRLKGWVKQYPCIGWSFSNLFLRLICSHYCLVLHISRYFSRKIYWKSNYMFSYNDATHHKFTSHTKPRISDVHIHQLHNARFNLMCTNSVCSLHTTFQYKIKETSLWTNSFISLCGTMWTNGNRDRNVVLKVEMLLVFSNIISGHGNSLVGKKLNAQ